MSYQHILMATDFSETADHAIELGARLARLHQARVSLVHAYDLFPMPSAVSYPAAMWTGADVDQQVRADAQRSLEEMARDKLADLQPVEATVLNRTGPALAICDHAEEHGVDLIVVGTHGRTGVSHLLIGSVAETVVRHAPCPVLVARPSTSLDRFPTHVIACTDFSPASEPGLEQAAELARAHSSRITLLHVYESPPPMTRLGKEVYRSIESIDADLKKALADLERKHFGGAVTTALLMASSSAKAIALYAERHEADLVCVATHGRTGLARMLTGSVAEKIVRHAPCSVLVARSRLDES